MKKVKSKIIVVVIVVSFLVGGIVYAEQNNNNQKQVNFEEWENQLKHDHEDPNSFDVPDNNDSEANWNKIKIEAKEAYYEGGSKNQQEKQIYNVASSSSLKIEREELKKQLEKETIQKEKEELENREKINIKSSIEELRKIQESKGVIEKAFMKKIEGEKPIDIADQTPTVEKVKEENKRDLEMISNFLLELNQNSN